LAEHSVAPGPFTVNQQQLRNEQQEVTNEQQLSNEQQELENEQQLRNEDRNNEASNIMNEEQPDDLHVSFDNMSVSERSPLPTRPPSHPPTISSPSPFISPARSIATDGRSSTMMPPAAGGVASLAHQHTTPMIFSPPNKQDGTKSHPYVMMVSHEFPERNVGFDIEIVAGVEHNDHFHSAVVIRKTVCVLDHNGWEASMVPAGEFKTSGLNLDKRLILIKSPSRDFWMRDSDLYHQKLKCEPTKLAHQATEVAIADSESRQYAYWLLVFPPDVRLDNKVFSGDGTHIVVDPIGVSIEPEDNDTGQKLLGMVLCWTIAQEKSSRRIKKKTPVKRGLKDMYA
jgi:hypothetical protein